MRLQIDKKKLLLTKDVTTEKGLEQCWERTSLLKNLNMCEHTTRKGPKHNWEALWDTVGKALEYY
jgi:hypothetical protein